MKYILYNILFILSFSYQGYSQGVDCKTINDDKTCFSEWIIISESKSFRIQVRLMSREDNDLYYLALGRLALEKEWQNIDKPVLIINDFEYPIEPIDKYSEINGDGYFEILTFLLGDYHFKKIASEESVAFKVDGKRYVLNSIIKQDARLLMDKSK